MPRDARVSRISAANPRSEPASKVSATTCSLVDTRVMATAGSTCGAEVVVARVVVVVDVVVVVGAVVVVVVVEVEDDEVLDDEVVVSEVVLVEEVVVTVDVTSGRTAALQPPDNTATARSTRRGLIFTPCDLPSTGAFPFPEHRHRSTRGRSAKRCR